MATHQRVVELLEENKRKRQRAQDEIDERMRKVKYIEMKMKKAKSWAEKNTHGGFVSFNIWKNKRPHTGTKDVAFFDYHDDDNGANFRALLYYKLARKFENNAQACRKQFKEEARVWCLCAKRLKIHKDIVSIVVKLLLTQEPFPRE